MHHSQRGHLPDPDDYPITDVVIYDRTCRLCRLTARLLNRLDRVGRLTFLPLQDSRVATRHPDLSPQELAEHVYVIGRTGKQWKGAEAVRYLTRRLPALWVFVPILHFPGSLPLWKWLYTQVSRRRHMFDGSK